MKKYYYTMRCMLHGDATLIAQGIGYNREEHLTQMNTGILKLNRLFGKIQLDPWKIQRGYTADEYDKIDIK